MRISLPIYIEHRRAPGWSTARHLVRPLFFPAPQHTDEMLSRAMAKLAQDLTRKLNLLAKEPHQQQLADYSFCPEVEQQRVKIVIELRRKVVRENIFCVVFRALGRKVAFCPNLPDVWIEIQRGESLRVRVQEVLTHYFRAQEKEAGDGYEVPAHAFLLGRAWVLPLEVDLQPAQNLAQETSPIKAFLGSQEQADGGTELQRVGRCLNWLYPAELDRVLHRDREVAELSRLLTAEDQRPVMLVGPRLVGKTAIIHEYVFRATAQRSSPYGTRENVWLLAPQRLVSGMSYVGQWENRLLAILKTARKREHILYFDDLLGLFQAGISSASSLNMAQVLRPFIERRDCRVLVEMTPESLRVLRERDRALADQFHLIPIAEPTESENLRIMFSLIRRLESAQRCRFSLDALPTVLELQRRYVRDGAFPGKAARFLQRLATQTQQGDITRSRVLSEFQAQSGLSQTFLDQTQKLERADILQALNRQVIGQAAPVAAVADILGIAKARLNDPERPLASLLFLGPTGVGKTQCAKAVANYLFNDPERLLRFDMNEFVTPGSAARLSGTFDNPEGLLTSAVRRQPFAIVLFDEIEKADPGVFDLLLQVLGEGRLTDSLGRTADFSNTMLILTSNLGVREAGGRVGFGLEQAAAGGHYRKAAENFFRPEFFNRLDRIIPFANLSRPDIRQIARLVIQDVLTREGLARRKCILQVDETTLDELAEREYSQQYGARALKRGIERHLTQPVAIQLAALRADAVTIVSLYSGQRGLAVDLVALTDAEPVAASLTLLDIREPAKVLERAGAALARFKAETVRLRPATLINPPNIAPEHFRYFALREQLDTVEKLRQMLEERSHSRGPTLGYVGHSPSPVRGPNLSMRLRGLGSGAAVLAEIAAAQDVHDYLRELTSLAPLSRDKLEEELLELLRQTALLQALATSGAAADEVLLYIRTGEASTAVWAGELAQLYLQTFNETLLVDATLVAAQQKSWPAEVLLISIKGPHAAALIQGELGTHLFAPQHAQLVPVQVGQVPLQSDGNITTDTAAFAELVARRQNWLREFSGTGVKSGDDPFAFLPVVRIYEERGHAVDLRTGLISPAPPSPEQLRTFILSALPLPPEIVLEPG